MAASTQWEVVGKPSKKSKKPVRSDGKMTKGQLKSFLENMPTVKTLDPVKESPTMYEAFLPKERRQEPLKTSEGSKGDNNKKNNKKKMPPPPAKKKPDDPKPAQSLEEALAKLNVEELSSFLTVIEERFPSTPLIWLKDLVSYLNVKLAVEAQDPVYSGQPVDYPWSVVPSAVQKLMQHLFDKCPDAVLNLFFEHVVALLVEDTAKGLSTSGSRIVVQSLAFSKPGVTLTNLQRFKDLRSQSHNRQPVCLSLLWALGQGGVRDLPTGLKIWLEMMLPVMSLKNYSKYTIDYLDVLFRQHSDVLSCNQVLGIREFFPVLDTIFSHTANLTPVLHKQLLGLYPKLKTVAFGPQPEQVLRQYFPSFLVRLVPNTSVLLRNELQSCLTQCLATDQHCYSVWRQLYTKHLVQSSLLLQHLLTDWSTVGSRLPRKLLKETLGTFCVTNDELGTQGRKAADGYREAVKACEDLLKKMSVSAMLPWRMMLVLVLALVGGLVAYDIASVGSFQASTTGQVLHDIGVLSVCHHAWTRISIYSGKAWRWSEDNIPIYYGALCNLVDPYIKSFWNQLYLLGLVVADQSKEIRQYLLQKLPLLLQWVDDTFPQIIQRQAHVLADIGAAVQNGFLVAVNYVVYYLTLSGTLLQENVFTGKLSAEHLQKYTLDTVEVVQEYTYAAFNWVNEQIAGFTTSGK